MSEQKPWISVESLIQSSTSYSHYNYDTNNYIRGDKNPVVLWPTDVHLEWFRHTNHEKLYRQRTSHGPVMCPKKCKLLSLYVYIGYTKAGSGQGSCARAPSCSDHFDMILANCLNLLIHAGTRMGNFKQQITVIQRTNFYFWAWKMYRVPGWTFTVIISVKLHWNSVLCHLPLPRQPLS